MPDEYVNGRCVGEPVIEPCPMCNSRRAEDYADPFSRLRVTCPDCGYDSGSHGVDGRRSIAAHNAVSRAVRGTEAIRQAVDGLASMRQLRFDLARAADCAAVCADELSVATDGEIKWANEHRIAVSSLAAARAALEKIKPWTHHRTASSANGTIYCAATCEPGDGTRVFDRVGSNAWHYMLETDSTECTCGLNAALDAARKEMP